MLHHNETLNVLFLHWNKIRSAGAIALAKALETNKYIQVFDASFNNFAVTNGKEVAKAFSQMFKNNHYLLHIDISFCNFKAKHAERLNEGLIHNHSILGIHMLGNEAEVDAQGFIRPS